MNTHSKPKLLVISGSSGVGKGTVIKELLKQCPDLNLSISCTTRNKRPGEEDGVNYFFISEDEFKKSVSDNEFLEWAEFSGNFYGTKQSYIKKCLDDNKHVLLEIETQGALQIKAKMPEAVLIFIAPPSFEELETRLRGRHTETEEAIQKRLNFVKFELENSKKYDYIIVNDTINNAVNKIIEIIGV